VRLAAVAGLGIAQLLPYGCKAELTDGRLRTILPGVTGPGGRLWIVYPSRRHLSPTVRAFIDHVLEQFSPTPDGGL
jgi:DNA-binding transcriptional LysR family regulator